MTGLPKWIIKKYGVSKKAWAVFRGKAKAAGHTIKHSKVIRMARKKYSRSGGLGGGIFGRMTRMPTGKNILNQAIGGIVGGYVGSMLGNMVMPDHADKIALVGAAYGGGLGGVFSHTFIAPKVFANL